MHVRNLDTFYWIATLGSFRAASERLNLTQPAISARIQVLEQDLGQAVFVRDVRRAELTAAGRLLLPYAEQSVRLHQDVLSAFSETNTVEQTIRLGASETLVSTWLPDFLSHHYRARHALTFDLTVDVTNNLRNALVAREIDLAFLMGPIAEASVHNIELCTFDMVLAARADLAKKHTIWGLEDVGEMPILTFAGNTKPHRQMRELLAPHATRPLNITTSSSLGALIRLAASGYGLCAIPRAVAADALRDGTLQALETTFELPEIGFTASFVAEGPSAGLLADICHEAADFVAPLTIKKIYQSPEISSI